MNVVKLICLSLLYFSASPSFAEKRWEPDLVRAQANFEKETGHPLRAGHRIEPTIFPQFYAIRSGGTGAPSAYFREDMAWLGNVKKRGWWSINPSIEDNLEQRKNWLKNQVNNLPLDQLILIQRRTPPVAVIWSAPDCGFCRKLERSLEQVGASVYVAPVGIAEEGFQLSKEIYCDKKPADAWMNIMHGTANQFSPRSDCSYPLDMLNDIGFFLSFGRIGTPIVLFADGSTILGWDDQQAPAFLQEKIRQGIYFFESGNNRIKPE